MGGEVSEKRRRLAELLKGLSYTVVSGEDGIEVSGVSDDSRDVKKGYLFVAVRGERVDGHDYIVDALKKGALAVVAERFTSVSIGDAATLIRVSDSRKALNETASVWFGRPSERIVCVGVTGTNGKTTTAAMIRHILEEVSISTAVAGTLFHDTGIRRHPSSNTTPGTVVLQRLLSEAAEAKNHAFVMEVSSHGLAQRRVDGVSFDAAVLTNIGSDHLDYHKTHKSYRDAKRRLFTMLKPDSFAVINRDTPFWYEFSRSCRCGVITYSLRRKDATVVGCATARGFDGIRMDVNVCGEKGEFLLPLVGMHNCENALAAVSVCYFVFGLRLSEIRDALCSFGGVAGRLEVVTERSSPFRVVVDYAHTEGALAAALSALRPLTTNRLVLVFGCGGERDRCKRPKMARVAEERADLVIVTSDNPRNEDPDRIIEEICEGFRCKDSYRVIPDREEAIKRAVGLMRPGDVLLVAGKGHETYQVVKNRLLPFDDRSVVREAIGSVA